MCCDLEVIEAYSIQHLGNRWYVRDRKSNKWLHGKTWVGERGQATAYGSEHHAARVMGAMVAEMKEAYQSINRGRRI